MKRILLYILLFSSTLVYSQSIKRSVLGSFGASATNTNLNVGATFGQPPNAGTIGNSTYFIRQGFQQPMGCSTYPLVLTVNSSNQCEINHSFDFNYLGVNDAYTIITWDFGVGASLSTSSQANPTGISYSTTGVKTIQFTFERGGCTKTTSIQVAIYNAPQLSLSASNVLCNSNCDGSAQVNTNPALQTYSWSNGSSSAGATSLCAGQYFVTVTDTNGCTATDSVTITEPNAITLLAPTITDVLCYGESNGSAQANAQGGTPTYSTNWYGENANALSAGTYYYSVMDANGCEVSDSVTISEPQQLTATISSTDALCNGVDDGTAIVQLSGGTLPYSYSWSTGDVTAQASNLSAGNYSVDITDANGCTTTEQVSISQPAAIDISSSTQNLLCYGDANGSVDITANGGILPYTFSWDNGATTEDVSNLAAGNYTLTLTDSAGCNATENIIISEPLEITNNAILTNATCEEQNDGMIENFVSGGTMPYSYVWSNGQTSENLQYLYAGEYSVVISDFNSCVRVDTFTVDFDGFENCFFVPTVFTPNGDGVHDYWQIDGVYLFPSIQIQVFNRWGQLLFESNGYDTPWDGTHNGKELPTADYYFIIILNDGEREPLTGTITIKR